MPQESIQVSARSAAHGLGIEVIETAPPGRLTRITADRRLALRLRVGAGGATG